jgi:superoxide reductase
MNKHVQTLKDGTDFEKKHVPMIECKDEVAVNELYEVKVHSAGVDHPMEDGHFIQYIELRIGDLTVYRGSKTQYVKPELTVTLKAPSEGHEGLKMKLKAFMFCNLHGLWTYEKEIAIKK